MNNVTLPQLQGANFLTHSRMQCFKACPRKHYYRYELGVRRSATAKPLRMGAAIHIGLDLRAQGRSTDEATLEAVAAYEVVPDWCKSEEDIFEWMIEGEIVGRLLAAYFWYWERGDDIPADIRPVEVIETEQSFELPIKNPETGGTSTVFRQAGKRDQIVRLADGALVVMEHKTCSEDLSPTSDYWLRLRIDQQISQYVVAALEEGHAVTDVLYDAIRKPTIKPSQVPLVDEDGVKIVLDANGERVRTKDGKKWRESGDAAQGLKPQTRTETCKEFGDRLSRDIGERPDYYFARRRIPRLDADLDDFRTELWQQQQAIRAAQLNGRWYRNTSACLTMGRCEYLDVCHHGFTMKLPEGYAQVEHVHPELVGDDE